jgi:hypothetical protein
MLLAPHTFTLEARYNQHISQPNYQSQGKYNITLISLGSANRNQVPLAHGFLRRNSAEQDTAKTHYKNIVRLEGNNLVGHTFLSLTP